MYKRQALANQFADVKAGVALGDDVAAAKDADGPVSYTHLDVYKRQLPDHGLVHHTRARYAAHLLGRAGGPCLLYTSRCV